MTCESGNTEGLEPVDFRPISRPWDWNLWTSGPFQDHGLGMLGLLDHLGQDLFLANQAGWRVRGAIAPRWNQLTATLAATATASQQLCPSGKTPGVLRAGTKYPVRGIPHVDQVNVRRH